MKEKKIVEMRQSFRQRIRNRYREKHTLGSTQLRFGGNERESLATGFIAREGSGKNRTQTNRTIPYSVIVKVR